MTDKIELSASIMKIRYRVMADGTFSEPYLLFSTDNYEEAERFCWRYDGNSMELKIEKVWIRKK